MWQKLRGQPIVVFWPPGFARFPTVGSYVVFPSAERTLIDILDAVKLPLQQEKVKHGHNIPADKRPAMARRALEIFRAETAKHWSMNRAYEAIAAELDVSTVTARNLVRLGNRLEAARSSGGGRG